MPEASSTQPGASQGTTNTTDKVSSPGGEPSSRSIEERVRDETAASDASRSVRIVRIKTEHELAGKPKYGLLNPKRLDSNELGPSGAA